MYCDKQVLVTGTCTSKFSSLPMHMQYKFYKIKLSLLKQIFTVFASIQFFSSSFFSQHLVFFEADNKDKRHHFKNLIFTTLK